MDADALVSLLAEIPGREWVEAIMEAAPGSITRESGRGVEDGWD